MQTATKWRWSAGRSETLDIEPILGLMPGKQLRPLAARALGVQYRMLESLVIRALSGTVEELEALGAELSKSLGPYLT